MNSEYKGAFTCGRKDDKSLIKLLEKFKAVHKDEMKICKHFEECVNNREIMCKHESLCFKIDNRCTNVMIGMLNFNDSEITKMEVPKISIEEWNKWLETAKKSGKSKMLEIIV